MSDEQLRVSARVGPYILNAFKQTNRRSLSNVMVALNVQALNRTSNGREILCAALLLKLQQVSGEITKRDIQQILVVWW
jgi:hypothetical protein